MGEENFHRRLVNALRPGTCRPLRLITEGDFDSCHSLSVRFIEYDGQQFAMPRRHGRLKSAVWSGNEPPTSPCHPLMRGTTPAPEELKTHALKYGLPLDSSSWYWLGGVSEQDLQYRHECAQCLSRPGD